LRGSVAECAKHAGGDYRANAGNSQTPLRGTAANNLGNGDHRDAHCGKDHQMIGAGDHVCRAVIQKTVAGMRVCRLHNRKQRRAE